MTPIPPSPPVTEDELHAYVDGQLPAERQREVEAWLAGRPEEARRVAAYRAQKRELHALFDPVLDEPLPERVRHAVRAPVPWYARRLAAGLVLALLGGAAGWGLRGAVDRASFGPGAPGLEAAAGGAFAARAAVAHAVYSADARRPVEVDAAHEEQLVAWLSKRMAAPIHAPRLQALGYALEGGRLLPGGRGPVAQFMYRDASGGRLTLYVSNELGDAGAGRPVTPNAETAFRFAREGAVGVFYWVDGPFGYALAADAGRETLARVGDEVYRQLAERR
jgi:anti-sigma factor RsiW